MKLRELSKIVPGQLVGDGAVKIGGVAPIEEAKSGDLVFVLDPKFLASALSSPAAALIARSGAKLGAKPGLLVDNPRLAMAYLLGHFAPKRKAFKGIHKSAIIAKSTKLGKRVTIHPYVCIGEDCVIGDDTIIYPNATLYDGTMIGKRVIINAGVRIGVDGYGYVRLGERHVKIPQIGNVVVGDDVELYANVCISRATLGSTIIGNGTKIDNLSHIAHNCKIGKNCAIVSLVGFGGSVTLGDNVQIAGQAGVVGHVKVGANSVIMAKTGVTKDWPANSVLSGFPAMDHKKDLESIALVRRLPEVWKRFNLPK